MYSYGKKMYAANEFAFLMMWAGECHRELSVKNEEDVLLAVRKAYDDMSVRVISGLGLKKLVDLKSKELSDEAKKCREEIIEFKYDRLNGIRSNLAGEFVDIFNKGSFDYNDHNLLCEKFLKDFNGFRKEVNCKICNFNKKHTNKNVEFVGIKVNQKTPLRPPEHQDSLDEDLKHGSAQKIVNMTFKYLYLFPDACEYEKTIFNKCHMAIDDNIMQYFIDNTSEAVEGKKRKKKNKIFTVGCWSKLNEKQYDDIRSEIKKYLEEPNNLKLIENEYKDIKCNKEACSKKECKKENIDFKNLDKPFFAEFYIWEIRMKEKEKEELEKQRKIV